MDTLILKSQPTLKDFQEYITEMSKQRGFTQESLSDLFMLLFEECGELAKSARKSTSIKTRDEQERSETHLEAADVFIYLLEICNHFNIDLEQAFRQKEEINKQRIWK